jgi:chromosome partitioning protein
VGTVVAIANQKGGVGKTTTAIHVAAYLGLIGPVLLVDCDPQGNATSWLGQDPRTVTPSLYEALLEDVPLASAVRPTEEQGVSLVPANRNLAGAQVELIELPDRDRRLEAALAPVRASYDLILLDCPPSLGLLTLNALAAADAVLVPVQCEYLALEGLGQLMESIELVRQRLNPRLDVLGLLLTMADGRTNLSVQVQEEVRRHFAKLTFATVIPRNVRLSEAPSHGRSLLRYDAASRGSVAYARLADELVQRGYSVAAGGRA